MYQAVIDFWFNECQPEQWWQKDEQFDQLIRDRFGDIHRRAAQCELTDWRAAPEGRLAEVIVLDQFSRNMFRDTPSAFAYDPLALALSQWAIDINAHESLTALQRSFLYMPFMHSESASIHEQALKLFKSNGNGYNLDYEIKHKVIIDRFGRYPHRNKILGRQSTAEEIEFLQQPDSSF